MSKDKKIKFFAYEKRRFESNIPHIEKELTEDPERHPSTVIANYGFTFYDDIARLREYAVQTGHPLVVKAIDYGRAK